MLTAMEIVMPKDNEFASEYAAHLVSHLTTEQRQAVFAHIETFFDEKSIAQIKNDVQTVVEERADMDRVLAEMQQRESASKVTVN